MNRNNHISHFINPNVLFAITWSFVYILSLLRISYLIRSPEFYSGMYVVMVIAIILFTRSRIRKNEKRELYDSVEALKRNRLLAKILWGLFIFETAREYLFFNSMPLFSAFRLGDEVTYIDANSKFSLAHIFFSKSITLFLSAFYLVRYFLFKKRKYFVYFSLTIVFSFIVLSRMQLLAIGFMSFILVLYFRKISTKHIIIGILVLGFVFFIFDKMYFLRNMNSDHFIKTKYIDRTFINSVINGSAGIYEYMVIPINNMLFNLENESFRFFEFRPMFFIDDIFPNKLYYSIFGETKIENKEIVLYKGHVVYTFLPSFFFAFGVYGTLFIVLCIGIFFNWVYTKFKLHPQKWFLVIIFLSLIIVLSIFSNSFVNPFYITLCIIAYLFPPIETNKKNEI
jgi:oligosaccharide repeat unit polymerase